MLTKEYQQRERDFVAREEMHQTQASELTQHYDGIVMRLKDRVIALEAAKAASGVTSPSTASDSVTPTNAESAPSKPTRDANDNEEISTHHGVTHQTSSSSGHHSGPSDKHKHHSRKPSGGDGVGDGSGGSGATPEVVGVAGGSSEPDAATAAAVSTKDSFSSGAAVAAAATTTATTTNLHSTSSSIDDVFSPLRGQTLVVGGRTSSQADSSALSPSNNTPFFSDSSMVTPGSLASGNKSLSKSASGLFRSQYLHGKPTLADESLFSSINSQYLQDVG